MSEEWDESLPIEQWPDDQLLRAASNGNTRAFEVYCVRGLPGLRRYLRRKCAELGVPLDLSDDFVQETILRALSQIRSTRQTGARPLPKLSVGWLFQVGYNAILDWKRKNRRIKDFETMEGFAEVEADRGTTERYEEVLKFFNWLPLDDRELLELILIEEIDIVDAGAQLGLSAAASYKRYERAMRHLRDLLDEHGAK